MRPRRRWAAPLAATLLTACHPTPAPVEGPSAERFVDARCHDAFWLWPGVRSQPALARARRVYVLAAQVEGEPARLVAQRRAPTGGGRAELWMVVRAQTLAWTPLVHRQFAATLDRWRIGAGAVGVQIDFDARTAHLDRYAAFLADLRRRLPPGTGLSVTGLLDWSAGGDPAALAALGRTVDEVVLQLHQGRQVIPGHERWLARLDRVRLPFRLGLPQGGRWTPPAGLADNPYYRGTVVFLLNDAPPPPARLNCASDDPVV